MKENDCFDDKIAAPKQSLSYFFIWQLLSSETPSLNLMSISEQMKEPSFYEKLLPFWVVFLKNN